MARRTRPRPRRRHEVAKSRLAPCLYQADPLTPDPRDPDRHMCLCGLPQSHPRHQPPVEADPAQQEHRRRIGDDQ